MKRLLLTLTLVAGVFAATAANSDPYEKSNLAKDFSQATDEEVNRAAQIDALRYWDLSGEYMTNRDDVRWLTTENLTLWARSHHIKHVSLYVSEAVKSWNTCLVRDRESNTKP